MEMSTSRRNECGTREDLPPALALGLSYQMDVT